ncbi:MAG TPA: DUF1634 domain-containing protein [bacterium]|nr:DUF1634 domain-containing protein [bacterium]
MDSESSARPPAPPETSIGEINVTGRVLGTILRAGVLISAGIILVGLALFVRRRGAGFVLLGSRDLILSSGETPSSVRDLLDAVRNNAHLPAAVTDIGLLTLMATPVLSVVVSLVSFARNREWHYVVLAAIVLCMLALGSILGSI